MKQSVTGAFIRVHPFHPCSSVFHFTHVPRGFWKKSILAFGKSERMPFTFAPRSFNDSTYPERWRVQAL